MNCWQDGPAAACDWVTKSRTIGWGTSRIWCSEKSVLKKWRNCWPFIKAFDHGRIQYPTLGADIFSRGFLIYQGIFQWYSVTFACYMATGITFSKMLSSWLLQNRINIWWIGPFTSLHWKYGRMEHGLETSSPFHLSSRMYRLGLGRYRHYLCRINGLFGRQRDFNIVLGSKTPYWKELGVFLSLRLRLRFFCRNLFKVSLSLHLRLQFPKCNFSCGNFGNDDASVVHHQDSSHSIE